MRSINYIRILIVSTIVFYQVSGYTQNSRSIKYNINVLGIDVGIFSVNEQMNDIDTIIHAITDVDVRILFRFRVKYIQESVYRSGELLSSSIKTYKNKQLKSTTTLIRSGEGYILTADQDTSFIHDVIRYSGSLLYFHEPLEVKEMYIELSGKKVQVEKTGDHEYLVTDPQNGRTSRYRFKNGELQGTAIEHRLATIYTERIPD